MDTERYDVRPGRGGAGWRTLAHAVPAFPTVSEVWLHLLEALER